ncbi:hypothetical protein EMIHUDRAFT_249883, partial [Emiliania huxleyi CCMP1516]|uniref:UBA domain-containing protein n=2 Tax=Emiliania huxleyi TaxID=2903 RepID=A0A0D3I5B7_EMIH1
AGGEAECLVLKHEQAVLALALLDDGRLATGAGDGKVTLWTPSAGGAGFTESGGCRVSTPVRGLAPLPGGGFGQVGNDGVLRSFSSDAVEQHASAPCGAYLLCVAALGRGSHQLATGGDDGVVRLWAAPPPPSALACLQELRTPGDVYGLCVLPGGEIFCASDEAGAFMGGGSAQIYWNRGDDIDSVAAQFAMRNGRSALLAQLAAMGFEAARAQAALERAGWDVDAALTMLLG